MFWPLPTTGAERCPESTKRRLSPSLSCRGELSSATNQGRNGQRRGTEQWRADRASRGANATPEVIPQETPLSNPEWEAKRSVRLPNKTLDIHNMFLKCKEQGVTGRLLVTASAFCAYLEAGLPVGDPLFLSLPLRSISKECAAPISRDSPPISL